MIYSYWVSTEVQMEAAYVRQEVLLSADFCVEVTKFNRQKFASLK